MGGQRSTGNDISKPSKLSSKQQRRASESNSELDTSDVTAHSESSSVTSFTGGGGASTSAGLAVQRHCSSSLDTLVNEGDAASSSSRGAPNSALSHANKNSNAHTSDSCIVVDGCEYIVDKAPVPPSARMAHVRSAAPGSVWKPPSDCSTSSGIERTDTQSDTSA